MEIKGTLKNTIFIRNNKSFGDAILNKCDMTTATPPQSSPLDQTLHPTASNTPLHQTLRHIKHPATSNTPPHQTPRHIKHPATSNTLIRSHFISLHTGEYMSISSFSSGLKSVFFCSVASRHRTQPVMAERVLKKQSTDN